MICEYFRVTVAHAAALGYTDPFSVSFYKETIFKILIPDGQSLLSTSESPGDNVVTVLCFLGLTAVCCGVGEQPTATPPKWARVYCGF